MAHFETQRNIMRFEALLRDAALEPAKRRTVELLLAEEKEKLRRTEPTEVWVRGGPLAGLKLSP